MKHQFTVHEGIDEGIQETHFDTIQEAADLMFKINEKGGRSYMTRLKADMVDHSGLSSSSTGERYYNKNNGKLREGRIDGRH